MEGLLSKKLLMARLERGLTLRDAAKLTGVSKETISELERGKRKPHPPTLYKLAQGYEVKVADLLEQEEETALTAGKADAPYTGRQPPRRVYPEVSDEPEHGPAPWLQHRMPEAFWELVRNLRVGGYDDEAIYREVIREAEKLRA